MHDHGGRAFIRRLAPRRVGVLCALVLLVLPAVELGVRAGVLRIFRSPGHPSYVRHDPWLGWSNRPNANQQHVTDDFDVTVRVNEHGFRGGPWPGLRDGRSRVLVLGDSKIFGWGVEDHECATALLGESHPEWDVINAGVIGYGTGQEFVLLKRLLPETQPSVVVVVFSSNDPLEMMSRHAYGKAKPWLERRGDQFDVRGTPLTESWLQRHSLAWREYMRWKSHRAALALQRDLVSELQLTRDVFRAMQRMARVPLLILSSEEALAEFAEGSPNIFHVHLDPVLDPLGPAGRFPSDPHWTPAAHAAVAEALHKVLAEILP